MTEDMFSFAGPATIGPPQDEADRVDRVRLIRSRRVGATTFRRLMGEHGSAGAALAALPRIASDAGVRDYAPCALSDARAELDRGRALGARPVFLGDVEYPALLAGIADAPPFLWMLGDPSRLTGVPVALVGARNASALGRRMAERLARELGSSGAVIVSGLARGIDAAAHKAALPTGTVAVLAGGVDVTYPEENSDLHRQIAEQGVLLSEMPPGLNPQARHFPRRNRIISGLSAALVVVEGASKSGSLITARTALDQGREVMAVPGHPFDARAAGCNMLIRDGATLVRGAADVAAALGLQPVARPVPSAPVPAQRSEVPDIDRRILALLGPSPLSEDVLVRELGRPAQDVLPRLAELDLEGRIDRHPGGLISARAG